MRTSYGWLSRASLSGVFSLYAFTCSVFGFPAGRWTDAWGPARVIVCGAVFLGGALAAMAPPRVTTSPAITRWRSSCRPA